MIKIIACSFVLFTAYVLITGLFFRGSTLRLAICYKLEEIQDAQVCEFINGDLRWGRVYEDYLEERDIQQRDSSPDELPEYPDGLQDSEPRAL